LLHLNEIKLSFLFSKFKRFSMGDMIALALSGDNFSKSDPHLSGDDWIAHPFQDARVCGVLDGARSPYYGLKDIAGFPSDVFAARWFKQEMLHQLLDHPFVPLSAHVQKVNYLYGDMWPQLLMNEGLPYIDRKINAPAAAFAFAMLREGQLTWAQGADCVLYLVLANGQVIKLEGDQFAEIVPEKKNQMTYVSAETLLAKGTPTEDILRHENGMIAHNRALIYNQTGGIAVLNGEPSLNGIMKTGMLDVSAHLGTGAQVIAMTDGCFQKLGSNYELAAMMATQQIAEEGLGAFKDMLLNLKDPFPTEATAVVMAL
jgi:hypothetical protein